MRFSPGELIECLDEFSNHSNYEFWPDDLSLRDNAAFARDHLHSSRTITDIYLLALATKHQGSLATFDQAIAISAVSRASAANLATV